MFCIQIKFNKNNKMKSFRIGKLLFVAIAFALLFACNPPARNNVDSKSEKLPNIAIIYLDGLGYGDVGAYGSVGIATPNIDKLAYGGIRFTNGYYDDAVEKLGNHKPAGELRGGKYSLYDAGTRVPFITY